MPSKDSCKKFMKKPDKTSWKRRVANSRNKSCSSKGTVKTSKWIGISKMRDSGEQIETLTESQTNIFRKKGADLTYRESHLSGREDPKNAQPLISTK